MSDRFSNIQVQPGSRSELIINAAYRMARVFVRLFTPYLQTSVLVELVTQAGVEAAQDRCVREAPGKKVTLSKLSMITGVGTKLIKEMLQRPKQIADYHVCAEAAILARWSKDPSLRSHVTQQPADLPVFGNDGSFQSLVSQHAGRGISTPTVLNRLESTGNVKVVNKHFVRMINPHWCFIEDHEDELLDFGTQSLMSLCNTIQNNIENRNNSVKKLLERRVFSLKVENSKYALDNINQLLTKQKTEMLDLVNAFEADAAKASNIIVGAGYYAWTKHAEC